MGDLSQEPSMEDILSSIKRIIADDAEKALSEPRPRRAMPRPATHDEFGGRIEGSAAAPAVAEPHVKTANAADPDDVFELTDAVTEAEEAQIVSDSTVRASKVALESLSTLVVKPEVSGTDTLEGLVRDMLRPMLRDWLDAQLPGIVEAMVAREIARITGKTLI